MANKKSKKQLHVMKRNHVVMTILLFAVILGSVFAVLLLSYFMLGQYFLASKLSAEYSSIQYLSQIYEQATLSGEDAGKALAISGRDYFVLDDEGKVLAKQGNITCTMQEGEISLPGMSDPITAYLDVDDEWLRYDENNLLPEYSVIVRRIILKTGSISVQVDQDSEASIEMSAYVADEELRNQMKEEMIVTQAIENEEECFPVWVSVPFRDMQGSFVARAKIRFNGDEMIIVVAMILLMVALLLILLVLMIGNLIRNAHRTKKIVNTYLTDAVTQGHNWTWFILKGEPLVQSSRYADKKLAVIELIFINYRNFCTCHSIQEGERMLCRMYEVITKGLTKREACAHVATSSFAILMEYEDEEHIKARLRTLIEDLENIDRNHKFAFHIGVRLLDIERRANGKPARRRKLNLEEEYNNACTARLTLAASDDSRIAFFDQKLVEEKKWIDAVMERQEKAIANEEFVVYYQPKYDPKTRKLRGAEALIRWNSPDLGFISPGKFIPIFEKNGFITEIDHYMLTHVAADQKAWLDQGLDCVTVSVNVSRAHFIESDLAEQIRSIVDQAGTPRNLIEIELTESAFFDDKNAMISTIQKLKEYGFKVSMDDFGAGYSSLNSLKDMPLDVLKLDADFFRGETEGGRGDIVVSGAIQLAKSLHMRTVAEGVEEKSQVEFLAKHDCDMIQGYYFAKPMPKNEFVERMRAGFAAGEAESEPRDEAETPTQEAAGETEAAVQETASETEAAVQEAASETEAAAQKVASETEAAVQEAASETETAAQEVASETEAAVQEISAENDPDENTENDNKEP